MTKALLFIFSLVLAVIGYALIARGTDFYTAVGVFAAIFANNISRDMEKLK